VNGTAGSVPEIGSRANGRACGREAVAARASARRQNVGERGCGVSSAAMLSEKVTRPFWGALR